MPIPTMPLRSSLVSAVVLLLGCDRPAGRVPPTCGVAALAAATTLLEQFTIPNQTLAAAPSALPERVVTRVIADGAFPAVVGRTDSLLVIGMEGNPPAGVTPGFGVLVVDTREQVIGVALYEGDPIPGAPKLGEVSVGGGSVPLIGVQVDPAKITDPSCPSLFPDSIIR
jgi:hypothetical protein